MHPRVLIIATTPYSENYSSRSLDAYFHYWEKDNVAQIFTRNIIPTKGHCGELFQISDAKLLKRWMHKNVETGRLYLYDELCESGANQVIDDNAMQRIGTKHTPTIEILRRILWRKKFWCTTLLNEWLDKFQPECIFYNFSNHIFTQQIVLFIAEKYDIPIITAIGDDFYFNDQNKVSPAYHLYRIIFKKLTRKILTRKNASAVYVSHKIREKYEQQFNLKGRTIYFNSTVPRKNFCPINTDKPVIAYFGNIRLGRNNSLLEFATALGKVNSAYTLEVYAGESDPTYYEPLQKHPNIKYGGKIPYEDVRKKTKECDIVVVVEGFRDVDIAFTKYSLSTKAADSLSCGSAIMVYGPEEAGIVDYFKRFDAAMVCTNPDYLEESLFKLINDVTLQKEYYEKAKQVAKKNHTVQSSTRRFEDLLLSVVECNKNEKLQEV